MLYVSLDCPLLIAPSLFCNGYQNLNVSTMDNPETHTTLSTKRKAQSEDIEVLITVTEK
jgi:hypothetical protein